MTEQCGIKELQYVKFGLEQFIDENRWPTNSKSPTWTINAYQHTDELRHPILISVYHSVLTIRDTYKVLLPSGLALPQNCIFLQTAMIIDCTVSINFWLLYFDKAAQTGRTPTPKHHMISSTNAHQSLQLLGAAQSNMCKAMIFYKMRDRKLNYKPCLISDLR